MIQVQAAQDQVFKIRPERVFATAAVASGVLASHPEQVQACLQRHFTGDWGNVTEDDKVSNDVALVDGERLLSSFEVGGQEVWIITDPRLPHYPVTTTVLYPEDY